MVRHQRTRRGAQAGFTLLELVIVVVIIGILAAVAVPQFFNLADRAEENAVKATAANLGSAAAMNYAACKLGTTDCNRDITSCATTGNLVNPAITTGIAAGATGLCTYSKGGYSASFPFPGSTAL